MRKWVAGWKCRIFHALELTNCCFPKDPITLSEDDWGVQSPPKRIVFRFHYHSQKVIGSLWFVCNDVKYMLGLAKTPVHSGYIIYSTVV